MTTERHFLDKALLKDRNFVLSTIMFFAVGFVLLPTLALTSPMLEELLGYPVDTTGYMTIPRGIGLVGALLLMSFVPARIDYRLFIIGGTALVVYANWQMLGYSPEMDWLPVAAAGFLQGAGLGVLMPAVTKAAFGTLDPKFRPEGTAIFNLSRLYGSTIGIAVVQIYFYNNTQAVHLALAKNLTPYRAAAHGVASMSKQALAGLNEVITGQAAVIAVIDQFKILMIVMLMVSPLVLFLRKPQPAERAAVLAASGTSPTQRRASMAPQDALRYTKIPLTHGSGAIPAVGFGTLIPDPVATKQATKTALEVGFRHFDCAERYRNEEAVGDAMQEAFKAGTIQRQDVFVTTKLWNTNHRPERVKPAFEASLRRLQLDYVDCYIIHTPFAFQPGEEFHPADEHGQVIYDSGVTLIETWRALEQLMDEGRCRSIGLSDIGLEKLREIVAVARIKPAAIQVESHPYLPEWEAARLLSGAGDRRASVCSAGTCHGAESIGRSGHHSDRTARPQDSCSGCFGLGSAARHRVPDDLSHASPYPREF